MNDLINKRGQFLYLSGNKVPSKGEVNNILADLVNFLFPILADKTTSEKSIAEISDNFKIILLSFDSGIKEPSITTNKFIDSLTDIYNLLISDANAIFEGDPAAKSIEEVIISYPGFYAIAISRLAHLMYNLKIPLIPRMFTEYAHSMTGIDIHPGAKIGKSFCIDHGTGVVIGETTLIGNNVKIYQGVTLGALSVSKNMNGEKRHPTVEDDVCIYAGSTILGGKTIIGHHSVIGGNVWLTKSVDPYSVVLNRSEIHLKNSQPGYNDIINYVI